jgi:anti-sigma factor RsiW
METMKTKCTGMESKLADMLLDPESVPAKVQAHVDACEGCRAELAELRATMSLMDAWESPEPSPYFLSKLDARMREERATAPASWLEKLRARLAYGPSMHVRPLAAMALAVVLLLGGGTYLGITDGEKSAVPQPQAYVHDLQTLDNNAQLLEQLDSISSTNDNNGD